ncbi:MAG: metal-dependent hydrolase, partial [Acidimicrobiia bacterium]
MPTRRISFEASLADLPRHFAADGDLIQSHIAAALSSLFPDGEDFFVRSVRRFRDRIDDPVLKRQVAGHGREHRVLNRRLAELGYPTRLYERFTRRSLALRERIAPATANLALTAALEHVTATLAELLLSDEGMRQAFGHPEVRNLFLWHALEELEHKAVAFDVYRAVGGSERLRILTMRALRVGFVLLVAAQVAFSLALDPATYRRGKLRRSLARLRTSPLVSRRVWDQLGEYTRPGFH